MEAIKNPVFRRITEDEMECEDNENYLREILGSPNLQKTK